MTSHRLRMVNLLLLQVKEIVFQLNYIYDKQKLQIIKRVNGMISTIGDDG
jgi:hypothetical protein